MTENSNPQVTIIGPDYSSYVRSVRLALDEKGVTYELSMNGMKEIADLKGNAHRKLHPFGKVPVLLHGDHVVFETSVILEYIEEAFDGPSLLDGTPFQRAEQRAWASAFDSYAYQPIVREYILLMARQTPPKGMGMKEFAMSGIAPSKEILNMFEKAYEGKIYLNGSSPGLADILIVIMIDYLAIMPTAEAILGGFPNLKGMLDNFKTRPSYPLSLSQRMKEAS